MQDILEGIKRLREQIALKRGVIKEEPLVEALELYSKFTREAIRISALINAGTVTEADRAGMRKLEDELDSAWQKLSEGTRKELVDMLLIKKMLPEEVGVALCVFDAKVVSLV